jgi:hypothetical protein
MSFALTKQMTQPALRLWLELRFSTVPCRLDALVFQLRELAGSAALRLAVRRLDEWCRAGLVIRTQKRPEAWLMTDPARKLRTPPEPAYVWRDGRASKPRARMWSAMRILRRFDLVELVITAEVKPAVARRFCGQLTRAAILSRAADGTDHWRLIHDLGPQHPRQRRVDGRLQFRDANDRSEGRLNALFFDGRR